MDERESKSIRRQPHVSKRRSQHPLYIKNQHCQGPIPPNRPRRNRLPRKNNPISPARPPRASIHPLRPPAPRNRRHLRRHNHHPPSSREILHRNQRRLPRKGLCVPHLCARHLERIEPLLSRHPNRTQQPRPHRAARPSRRLDPRKPRRGSRRRKSESRLLRHQQIPFPSPSFRKGNRSPCIPRWIYRRRRIRDLRSTRGYSSINKPSTLARWTREIATSRSRRARLAEIGSGDVFVRT